MLALHLKSHYFSRVKLLRLREERLAREREEARLASRAKLRETLHALCPGSPVYVFGSLTEPFKFYRRSDVDVAVEQLPDGMSELGLAGLLEEELGRPVDLLLLHERAACERRSCGKANDGSCKPVGAAAGSGCGLCGSRAGLWNGDRTRGERYTA